MMYPLLKSQIPKSRQIYPEHSLANGPTLEPFSPEAGPSWVRSSQVVSPRVGDGSQVCHSRTVCQGTRLPVEGERCVVRSGSLLERCEVNKEEEEGQYASCSSELWRVEGLSATRRFGTRPIVYPDLFLVV